MIINYFDVTLTRLREDQLEELRSWRNSDFIRSRMHYRDHISSEMQKEWFKEVNNINQYLYLIVSVNGKNIGLCNGKNICTNNSEGGMFIWDTNYLNAHIPVVVSVFMSDFIFYFLGNEFTYCRILKSNLQSIDYNKSFGFKRCDGQDNNENQLYKMSRDDYESNIPALRSRIKNIYGKADDSIIVQLEKEDDANGVTAFMTKYHDAFIAKMTPVKFQLQHL